MAVGSLLHHIGVIMGLRRSLGGLGELKIGLGGVLAGLIYKNNKKNTQGETIQHIVIRDMKNRLK